ncbi:DUF2971 domain-containing protein [Pseudomonas sp. 1176_21]|uniref:DUF2971 domain-containing protein n=1 Tax=Pseudomonas sp. 1176_21 TaxID=2604453 RepID=UPI004063F7E6
MAEFKEIMLGMTINPEDISRGFGLKFKHIPSSLFKYREFDRDGFSLNNLASNTIWMNSPQNFNDPYDCALTVSINKLDSRMLEAFHEILTVFKYKSDDRARVLGMVSMSSNPRAELFSLLCREGHVDEDFCAALTAVLESREEKIIEEFSEKTKGLVKICSFCESSESILMWAHYARDHTGFCIEYDFTVLGSEALNTKFLYPVQYSEYLHDHADLMSAEDIHRGNPLSIVLPAITKSQDWSYEREWRLVYSNNLMLKSGAISVPTPVRVYAGVRISDENFIKLQGTCDLLGVPLTKMKMSRSAFKIVPVI